MARSSSSSSFVFFVSMALLGSSCLAVQGGLRESHRHLQDNNNNNNVFGNGGGVAINNNNNNAGEGEREGGSRSCPARQIGQCMHGWALYLYVCMAGA